MKKASYRTGSKGIGLKGLAIVFVLMVIIPSFLHISAKIISPPPHNTNASYQIKHHEYTSIKELKRLKRDDMLMKKYEKTQFFVNAIGGVFFVLLGLFIKWPILDSGFIFSGGVGFAQANYFYWGKLTDVQSLMVLLIALLVTVCCTCDKCLKFKTS